MTTTTRKPEDERIGRTLQTLRERYGYTRAQLANELGISTSYLTLIERGHKHLLDHILARVCTTLEISTLAIKHPDHEPAAA
jgi:transcriptional regulator with XRE-family HTH domain